MTFNFIHIHGHKMRHLTFKNRLLHLVKTFDLLDR